MKLDLRPKSFIIYNIPPDGESFVKNHYGKMAGCEGIDQDGQHFLIRFQSRHEAENAFSQPPMEGASLQWYQQQ
jgi:hypothetical protein